MSPFGHSPLLSPPPAAAHGQLAIRWKSSFQPTDGEAKARGEPQRAPVWQSQAMRGHDFRTHICLAPQSSVYTPCPLEGHLQTYQATPPIWGPLGPEEAKSPAGHHLAPQSCRGHQSPVPRASLSSGHSHCSPGACAQGCETSHTAVSSPALTTDPGGSAQPCGPLPHGAQGQSSRAQPSGIPLTLP